MHEEIKKLVAENKVREALDFVSRIKPCPGGGKKEDLIAIGEAIRALPGGDVRDALLSDLIEEFFHLGDIEHSAPFVVMLSDGARMRRYSEIIAEAIRRRQENASVS